MVWDSSHVLFQTGPPAFGRQVNGRTIRGMAQASESTPMAASSRANGRTPLFLVVEFAKAAHLSTDAFWREFERERNGAIDSIYSIDP